MKLRSIAIALLLAVLAAVRPASASIEEFSGFDVYAPEVDDENALDALLVRPLAGWRDEWETARSGVRADQGCMTAAIWYQSNEFKSRAAMGDHTSLDVGFLQRTDPGGSYQWLQFDVLRATKHWGEIGGRFRPAYDKSQQDFAALWRLGDAHAPVQADLTLSIEDTFNRLWTFRQAEVGDGHVEPYRVHPFEPSVDVIARGAHHRIEIADTWLTPMRQDVEDPDPAVAGTRTLRGNHARFEAEQGLGVWTGSARFESKSARSSFQSHASPDDGRSDRAWWTAELAFARPLGTRLHMEGRYAYQHRAQDWHPPVAVASFRALDRVGSLQFTWKASEGWQILTGLLYDRVGIATAGIPPGFSYGSRKESRGLIGLQARIGRVRLQAVEGIELDSEPYTVTFHHDKGFLHLQTTF